MGARNQGHESATIANGATSSGAIPNAGWAIASVVTPSAFTGTAISFTVSDGQNGTFSALYDKTGTLVSVPTAASRATDLPAELMPHPWMKIVSNAAEGAARTLTLRFKT